MKKKTAGMGYVRKTCYFCYHCYDRVLDVVDHYSYQF